jgi:hypothetical protein
VANSQQKFVLRAQIFSQAHQKIIICTAKVAISTFSHTLGILLSFFWRENWFKFWNLRHQQKTEKVIKYFNLLFV